MAQSGFNRRDVIKGLGAAGVGVAAAGISTLAAAQAPITVGFLYVGAKDDFGYNQAQAEAAAEMKKVPGIKAVEEENACPRPRPCRRACRP